jgi:hypothetical protein
MHTPKVQDHKHGEKLLAGAELKNFGSNVEINFEHDQISHSFSTVS